MNRGRLNISNTGRSVFLGNQAGENDDLSNNENVFVGESAGRDNILGAKNVALGYQALLETLSDSSTAVGYRALQNNSTGTNNLALGLNALESNSSGNYNIGIGTETGKRNFTGSNNTFVGNFAGRGSGPSNRSGNVMIGYRAGVNNIGNANIFIGHEAAANATGSNKLYIDNNDGANPLIYGEFDNDLLRVNGTLNITDNTTIDGTLDVDSNANIDGTLDVNNNTIVDGTLDVSSNVSIDGTLTVGSSGDAISSIFKAAIVRNVPNIGSSNAHIETFTVTGATVGSVAHASPRVSLGNRIVIGQVWVSSANTVSIRFRNTGNSGEDPPITTFDIVVIK